LQIISGISVSLKHAEGAAIARIAFQLYSALFFGLLSQSMGPAQITR
jgi:hypothetical protein